MALKVRRNDGAQEWRSSNYASFFSGDRARKKTQGAILDPIAAALRKVLNRGYHVSDLRADVMAGVVVGIVALPLSMALAIAVGAPPQHGLYNAIGALWAARGTTHLADLGVGAATLGLLLYLPRVLKKIPAPLVAITIVALLAALLHRFAPTISVATIGTRFHTNVGGVEVAGIPSVLPSPSLPWGHGFPTFGLIRDLFPAALAIALLGAIESLLSAVIADGMTGTKHDPNSELVGLGVANLIAPIFGGIAATGALARTATNVRAGARSPFAALTHSVIVLLATLLLARLVAYIPMASLAALLLLVAWNMSEVRQFVGIVKVAPKSDVFILLTCFFLTVFFDMVIAVSVGFVAAAMLFMRRMAELTETRLQLDSIEEVGPRALPEGTILYEINGPLFFGAAQTAMGTLNSIRSDGFRILVLNLGRVPAIDATGLVSLESAIARVQSQHRTVILSGPLPRPRSIFEKARLETKYPGLRIVADVETGLALAVELTESPKARTCVIEDARHTGHVQRCLIN